MIESTTSPDASQRPRARSSGVKLNQSVARATAILRVAAARPTGQTASSLARDSGLPWATAVRLIRTLEQEGLLYRLADDRYVLGLELTRLANAADEGRVLAAMARPLLERVAEEVQETVNLTVVRAGGALEIVDQIDPPHMIRTSDWLGGPYPLHASAIGKLLLASLDEPRRDEILSQPLTRYARGTITEPAVLREEVARIRTQGYSSAIDELEDGLAAVAVGIAGPRRELVALVSVAGPLFRFDETARERAVALIQVVVATMESGLAGAVVGGPLSERDHGGAPGTGSARRRRPA